MNRYFTKSRFKTAIDCPTKLYYQGKPDYEDQMIDDPFLTALAEGGFQVGELAKCYFPGGIQITEKGYDIPYEKTMELLKKENVVIYEAAIKYGNLFIRIDILVKEGNILNLYEVKAKSVNSDDPEVMTGKNGKTAGNWKPYVYDTAFQRFVLQNAFPGYKINTYLMLADKRTKASVNGLNQRFRLVRKKDGSICVERSGDTTLEGLGEKVLTAVKTDDLITGILNEADWEDTGKSFAEFIKQTAESYVNDLKIITPFNAACFSCQFQTDDEHLKSGYKECLKQQLLWTDADFNEPNIFEIWNFRRKQQLLDNQIYHIKDVKKEHIGLIDSNKDGSLSVQERQWLQIEKMQKNDPAEYFDAEGMREYMSDFKFPLHMIDFETSMAAIPFYEGRRPYEQIAFQFSHHVMHQDGKIEHKGHYLCIERGKFPNYEFLRALKKELENDEGTIFRYASHENTVLNQICRQLDEEDKSRVPDKDELIEFIHSITHNNDEGRSGDRDMTDMLEMVKRYYYHPLMGKSNSIKSVLPAVLQSSEYIQNKYSNPIYGKGGEIPSLNYECGWKWIHYDTEGQLISPYKLLPELFTEYTSDELDEFMTDPELKDGGAVMTAFAKMQFSEMSTTEKEFIEKGLLRYCELDTLAMVMIMEHWMNEMKS
jgi:hypothetical protein